jgi:pimeloyl-ACP methyl ester carboxylesterase
MTPQSNYLLANGLRHHLLEWSPAVLSPNNQTSIFCLHGFLDASWGFYWVAQELAAQGYHVIAPDWRGHGDSARIGAGGYYHFLDYVSDLFDLVTQKQRERLVIVGHSMGGSVAGYFTGAFPEKVSRLVMMESIMIHETSFEDLPDRMRDWISSVRSVTKKAPRSYATLQDAAKRLQSLDSLCTEAQALFLAEKTTHKTTEGLIFKHDPLHVTRGPYPFRLDSTTAFWRRINCPILMIEGKESVFLEMPGIEERYASFPAHQRLQIANAGHMMIRHAPAEVARLIVSFL